MEGFWLFCEPIFIAFTGMVPARDEQPSMDRSIDHGGMTVLRSREERGVADVASAVVVQARTEGFPARLDCPDAMDRDKLNKLACRMLWQI